MVNLNNGHKSTDIFCANLPVKVMSQSSAQIALRNQLSGGQRSTLSVCSYDLGSTSDVQPSLIFFLGSHHPHLLSSVPPNTCDPD